MSAQVSDILGNQHAALLYDAECGFCVTIVNWLRPTLTRRAIVALPLQAPAVRTILSQFGVSAQEILSEVRLITREGRLWGGAEAFVELARRIWWAKPLLWLAWLPGGMSIVRAIYRWVSQHRRQLGAMLPARCG